MPFGFTPVAVSSFNTQPPEGGWLRLRPLIPTTLTFQHTAARRRLGDELNKSQITGLFQHTAARRRLASTSQYAGLKSGFQHTAARRRLEINLSEWVLAARVSTHSRPKAAGFFFAHIEPHTKKFQHTAARRRLALSPDSGLADTEVSTHSRPKAAGGRRLCPQKGHSVSTHSRPKAAGHLKYQHFLLRRMFQHTAARRRLAHQQQSPMGKGCFNTQPPEGGWN